MTEYELADYATSVMSNFLSAIAIYFSIVTAYVVAAFAAGNRLSKLQLIIVNVTFTVAAGIMGLLSYLLFSRFYELGSQAGRSHDDTPLVDFSVPLGILVTIVYLGCLLFMWTVRGKSDMA
jgi:ABC-type sulfate transport system permease subunit